MNALNHTIKSLTVNNRGNIILTFRVSASTCKSQGGNVPI